MGSTKDLQIRQTLRKAYPLPFHTGQTPPVGSDLSGCCLSSFSFSVVDLIVVEVVVVLAVVVFLEDLKVRSSSLKSSGNKDSSISSIEDKISLNKSVVDSVEVEVVEGL